MKRKLAISGMTIALAVPALAFAGGGVKTNYDGHIVGAKDSAVRVKEAFGDLERAVKTFAVRDFTVQCEGGVPGTLTRTKLVGTIPVDKDGDFKARDDNGKTVLKVRGHIGRNKATGTFRYSGTVKADNGRKLDCDSGKLDWIARP